MSNRYLMWTLTIFVMTVLLCSFFSMKWIAFTILLALLAVVSILFVRFSWKKLVISCLIAFVLSSCYFGWTSEQALKIQNSLIDNEVLISGEITDVGRNSAGNLMRYTIKLSAIKDLDLPKYTAAYVNLYCDMDEPHLPGTSVNGKLQFFESPVEFGYGREDRILLNSFSEPEGLSFNVPEHSTITGWLYHFRSGIISKLSFGKEETQGLLRSVCFGDKETLDSSLKVSLRRNGLSHVTAVSGLHLSFTILLFNFLLMAMGLHYRIRYLLDIFIAIIFTVLVGFPLSCIRACVMIVLMCLGMVFNLFEDGLTSLATAAFIIVVVNPFAIRDVGFLLSIFSTAGIIFVKLPIENFLFPKKLGVDHRINWVYRKITGIFACSIAATLGTLPVIVLVFQSVSLIGPLANVVLIYPLQWCFMAGILMILLGWIPGVGPFLGWVCDSLYFLIKAIATFLGKLSFSSVSTFNFNGLILLILFLIVIGVGLYDFMVKKRRTTMILVSLWLCFCMTYHLLFAVAHPNDHVEIAFIDVGQGDCTVISKGHTAVIFDYGGTSQKRYQLIDYLKSKNIYSVELLCFTHLHADHTNGLGTLLNNVYVEEILYPDLPADNLLLISMIQAEENTIVDHNLERRVLENVRISALFDQTIEDWTTGNEAGVCYRISYEDTSILVTGDISGEAELKIAEQMGDTTILKVSHHGSRSSSMYSFIKAVSPEISVISVGENSFGLPDEQVINRLKTISTDVLLTREEGTIRFKTDGKTIERISK